MPKKQKYMQIFSKNTVNCTCDHGMLQIAVDGCWVPKMLSCDHGRVGVAFELQNWVVNNFSGVHHNFEWSLKWSVINWRLPILFAFLMKSDFIDNLSIKKSHQLSYIIWGFILCQQFWQRLKSKFSLWIQHWLLVRPFLTWRFYPLSSEKNIWCLFPPSDYPTTNVFPHQKKPSPQSYCILHVYFLWLLV